MSEEKKTQPSGDEAKDRKQHHPRKRGYFIDPNAAQIAAAPVPEIKEAVPSVHRDSQQHDQNRPQKKKQGHHKPSAQSRPTETAGVQEIKTGDASAKPKAQGAPNGQNGQDQQNPQKKKKNNNNKQHSTSSPTKEGTSNPQAEQKSSATAKATSKFRPTVKETRAAVSRISDEYEEYRLVVEEEEAHVVTPKKDDSDAPKTEIIGIRFKSTGKIYYFDPCGKRFKKGSYAIVDTARGQEFGEVAMTNSFVKSDDIVPPLRPVVRNATTADIEHNRSNKQKEEEAFKVCNEKIVSHGLDMKLIDAQYTFDNSKLLFYFTSSDRVDFRELVKDLASVFRTRIELRQIGIRDEAKIVGGLGMCGRPLCCTLFLSDFDQVSIKMAKEQNLSLNSAKISGICGRLMCCLKYEHEAYEYEIKRTPPVDSMVRTEDGDGVVTEISPLRGTVKVKLLATPEVPPKSYHRDNVSMLRKKKQEESK